MKQLPYRDSGKCKYCGKSKAEHYHDPMRNTYQCRFGGVIAVICQYEEADYTSSAQLEETQKTQ